MTKIKVNNQRHAQSFAFCPSVKYIHSHIRLATNALLFIKIGSLVLRAYMNPYNLLCLTNLN